MSFTPVKVMGSRPRWVDPKIAVGPATRSKGAGTSGCPDPDVFRVITGAVNFVFQVWAQLTLPLGNITGLGVGMDEGRGPCSLKLGNSILRLDPTKIDAGYLGRASQARSLA